MHKNNLKMRKNNVKMHRFENYAKIILYAQK